MPAKNEIKPMTAVSHCHTYSRREFLKIVGAAAVTAGVYGCSSFSVPTEQEQVGASASEMSIDYFLHQYIDPVLTRSLHPWLTLTDELDDEPYSGTLRYFYDTTHTILSPTQMRLIDRSIFRAGELSEKLFGAAARWTEGQTVFITGEVALYTDDRLRFIDGDDAAEVAVWIFDKVSLTAKSIVGSIPDEEAGAYFLDHLQAYAHHRIEKIRASNVISIPPSFWTRVLDRFPFNQIENHGLTIENFREADIIHELGHAMLQYKLLPKSYREGFSQFLQYYALLSDIRRTSNNSAYVHIENQFLAALRSASELFNGIVNEKNAAGESMSFSRMNDYDQFLTYLSGSYAMFSLFREQEDVFRNIREQENRLYTLTGNPPTLEQWHEMLKRSVSPPFYESWCSSHPVLQIPD